MRRRGALIACIALTVVVLDQISKYLVSTRLPLNERWNPIEWLRPIITLTYIHNTGAAFGILQNQNLFFTVVAITVITVIVFYLRSAPEQDTLVAIALGLQLGGAIGNLLDRLRYGYVIDFIHLQFWAISNVADVSISAGVLLLAYHLLFRAGKDEGDQRVQANSPRDDSHEQTPASL